MTAVWTAPRTWAAGEVVTAALLNTHLRDNLDWLKSPAAIHATGATEISTTATGDLVDMTSMSGSLLMTGDKVLVMYRGSVQADASRTITMGVRVDSVTTNFVHRDQVGTSPREACWHARVAGIAAGTRTISVGWRTSGGTMYQNGFTVAPRVMSAIEIN